MGEDIVIGEMITIKQETIEMRETLSCNTAKKDSVNEDQKIKEELTIDDQAVKEETVIEDMALKEDWLLKNSIKNRESENDEFMDIKEEPNLLTQSNEEFSPSLDMNKIKDTMKLTAGPALNAGSFLQDSIQGEDEYFQRLERSRFPVVLLHPMPRKRVAKKHLQALLEEDLDDEFLEDIVSDIGRSDSEDESYDDDETSDVFDFEDANDDDILLSGREQSTGHQWSQESCVSREPFPFVEDSGVVLSLSNPNCPMEIFTSFFDERLIEFIVNQTNKYAIRVIDQKRRSGKMMRRSRDLLWHDTNLGEMYCLIALVILQGIVQKPSIDSYHSVNPLIATPFFGKCISRDRFSLLLKYLNFDENETATVSTEKFIAVLDFLKEKFKSFYTPQKNISIDESLFLWKERLKWKRYIPLRRTMFGMKFYILVEAETGYVWDIIVYVGKKAVYKYNITGLSEEEKKNFAKSTNIVLSLISPLLNKGYTLGINNFYTSPELVEVLLANKTDCIGTVRFNRKNLCPEVRDKKLEKGETIARYKNKVMHLKWRDKKNVHMLSTIYDDTMENVHVGRKTASKPTVCINYKKFHMRRVNKVISGSSAARKELAKYYKKIFFRLVEISLHNSYVIFKKSGGSKTFLDFKLQIIEMLVGTFGKDVYWAKNKKPSCHFGLGAAPTRLTGRHFIIETGREGKRVQRRCIYCKIKNKIKKSIYSCDTCDVTLCITPCFKLYHTEEKLQ